MMALLFQGIKERGHDYGGNMLGQQLVLQRMRRYTLACKPQPAVNFLHFEVVRDVENITAPVHARVPVVVLDHL